VYLYKQDYKKAKMNFDTAFSFAKKSKSAFDIENTLNYYALLYEAQNDYKKASDYYKRKNEFSDSIQKLSNIKQLQELETKYQTAKKDAIIASSKAIIAERELKIEEKNRMIYSVFGFAIILGLLGFLFYRQQKIKNQQLIKENELKEALVKIENQNNLQEQRLTISKDLHDNIGSQLTFIISSLDNLKYFEFNKDKLYTKFDSIGTFTRSTITDLRDTIWAMNKEEITFEDLKTRTTNFIEAAKTSLLGISFEFNYPTNAKVDSLNSLQGIDVYRIVQEAVNNAIKHAHATKIVVDFEINNKELLVSIIDDGIGFDASTIEAGNGLNSMQKRAKEINAELTISPSQKGTKVSLKFQM
jgi:signal transduction histidine kinase